MDFGITFKGDISPKRTVALCKQAEVAGFRVRLVLRFSCFVA